MKAELKGDNLIITIPVNKEGKESKSGKTLVVASTGGNFQSDVKINGKPVTIGVNAYIAKD